MEDDQIYTDANKAVRIVLRSPSSSVEFHPSFTYPIFGDAERVYGFSGLDIKIEMDACTLETDVHVTYDKKLPAQDPNEPLNTLCRFLTPHRRAETSGLCHVTRFEHDSDAYTLSVARVPHVSDLHANMRVFALFFIEAGSYIDDSDDRWSVYVLRRVKDDAIAAFCTVYTYLCYRDASIHDRLENAPPNFPARKRVSQFVVLPPYQRRGLGTRFYSAVMDHLVGDPHVFETAAEDPSEHFDLVRDRADLSRLSRDATWAKLQLPLLPNWAAAARVSTKLPPRQFSRCVEMVLLHNLGSPTPAWRCLVKRRIFNANRDLLSDLDPADRKEKLHLTYQNVLQEYQSILQHVSWTKKRLRE